MKVLLINSVCGVGSTGRIVVDIAEEFIKEGHDAMIAYGRGIVPEEYKNISYKIGNELRVRYNVIKARLLDNEGFNAHKETNEFIKWADEYNPDVVWLHNLHGYYINIEQLFNWIKSRPKMQVKWTLHDCWAFTGHCVHFTIANCNRWNEQCNHCIQKWKYPKSLFLDNSRTNYLNKQNCFTGIKNMTIITPSKWLAKLVKQSFLKEYPVEVSYNKVNNDIFRARKSDFKEQHNIQMKTMILGVASSWSESKGLFDFIELSENLNESYQIVLVGINKKTKRLLPSNIITIAHTDNVYELAEIYSVADYFFNPSREETFGLTTLEAISCGTKAIVYKGTACEEVVGVFGNGIVVEKTVQDVVNAIMKY